MKFVIILPILILVYLYAIAPRFPRRKSMALFCKRNFAHRGLFNNLKNIPENSMIAFKNAVDAGYGIELDVQLTRDDRVVVFHDDSLSRICQIDLRVREKTYEELQELTLLQTQYKIPLLSDVLTLVDGRIPLLIEIKLPVSSTKTCKLVDEILSTYKGNYCIESFNSLALLWYRRHRPHVIRGQLSGGLTRPIAPGGILLCIFIEYLISNFLGRPDFISYSYKHTSNLSFRINKYIFHTPTMAWTIDSELAYSEALEKFDSFIFEGFII